MAETSDDTAVDGGREDGWRQVAQCRFEPGGVEELATTIVTAVAAAKGVEPTEITPPLYDFVDAAALEAVFFRPSAVGGSRGVGTVEFRYLDHLVTVGSDGWVAVFERTD
jgi:hypothetical protein